MQAVFGFFLQFLLSGVKSFIQYLKWVSIITEFIKRVGIKHLFIFFDTLYHLNNNWVQLIDYIYPMALKRFTNIAWQEKVNIKI